MDHFKTITDYCRAINIPPPKHPHFDIRSFEENMPTVVANRPPFRHEFYAIAIKAEGGGKAITGHHTDFPEGATIFFNSPFQLISWDIVPDWKGYYVMFSQDFIAKGPHFTQLLEEFPFLKIDTSIPFEVEQSEVSVLLSIYNQIRSEYHDGPTDKFQLIEAYVLVLLHHVKRYFARQVDEEVASQHLRTADLKLLSRFQSLIETRFYPNAQLETFANPHSPSYYAQKLSVHPNHLNSVVKGLTGHTALRHIQNHILQLAKSHLAQTEMSAKEVAYSLHFDAPNNFSAFFKKHTGSTPLAYRKAANL